MPRRLTSWEDYIVTQQDILLNELKKGKVNSYRATYDLRIKQAPTRIKELKQQGYTIISYPKKDRSVDWELLGAPKEVRIEPEYIIRGNTAYLKEDPKQLDLIVG